MQQNAKFSRVITRQSNNRWRYIYKTIFIQTAVDECAAPKENTGVSTGQSEALRKQSNKKRETGKRPPVLAVQGVKVKSMFQSLQSLATRVRQGFRRRVSAL
jgi:hypothetical protein